MYNYARENKSETGMAYNQFAIASGYLAVSYTHLDVYKRQVLVMPPYPSTTPEYHSAAP